MADEGGEINNDLDLIWQDKDIEVKDKLDAYGFVFGDLEAQESKLKEMEEQTSTKIKLARGRVVRLKEKLKARLHNLSNGETLRGNIYSFHPFETSHRIISNPEHLTDSESYLTIEIKGDAWDRIIQKYTDNGAMVSPENLFKIKKREGKVSELPEGHPAVSVISSPSVRIT